MPPPSPPANRDIPSPTGRGPGREPYTSIKQTSLISDPATSSAKSSSNPSSPFPSRINLQSSGAGGRMRAVREPHSLPMNREGRARRSARAGVRRNKYQAMDSSCRCGFEEGSVILYIATPSERAGRLRINVGFGVRRCWESISERQLML